MSAVPTHADVVVVGAGLAGLTSALLLQQHGLDVALVEAAERPGGRVVTERRDGLLTDRGFQLLNPAYPALDGLVDLDALELQPFAAGVAVRRGDHLHRLGDPRRVPSAAWSDLVSPLLPLSQKLALLRWLAPVGLASADRVRAGEDTSFETALRDRGLDGPATERVLRPFLAGVLADGDLDTSRRFVELVLRSFVRGTPSLPRRGMQALPEQLAARLAPDTLHHGVRVQLVTGRRVVTDRGTIGCDAVVVAADPLGAADLLGWHRPPVRGLTTFWWQAPHSPARTRSLGRFLHVDGDGLGTRGPVVNTAVVSDAAPSYAAPGALVQATVLGSRPEVAAEARVHAGVVLGADTGDWELVRVDDVPVALPVLDPHTPLRQPVDLGDGVYVAGDHRDTPSIQGALVSGRRAARAVLRTGTRARRTPLRTAG